MLLSHLKRHGFVAFLALGLPFLPELAQAADWISAPSYYTHDPQTAERVTQFSPIGPFYVYSPPNYMKSGYRHFRSSIQAGGSADNLHIVEEWGRPVVPYEQWRFPYRPYGSPYPAWGPPLAGAGAGYFGLGYGYGLGLGSGGGSPYYQPRSPAPWIDGHWPTYDVDDRSQYYEPYPSRRASHWHGW
jgi:hypothetical protein